LIFNKTNGGKFKILVKKTLFLRVFNHNSAKLSRTAKKPTVLGSLLLVLTIRIHFRTIYFLTNFRIFYTSSIFAKKKTKIKNF